MTATFFSPAPFYRRTPVANVFDELLDGFLVRPVSPATAARGFKFDVREAGNNYLVEADLPGLKKDGIKIEIDGAQVTISAEYKTEKSGSAEAAGKDGNAAPARVVYTERTAGAVARSFELPAEIDQAAASAKYEDGVLRLTLPKKIAETRKLLAIH